MLSRRRVTLTDLLIRDAESPPTRRRPEGKELLGPPGVGGVTA